MKTVKAHFILYIKEYQHSAGKPNSQACNIDKRIDFVLRKIAESDFQIITKHMGSISTMGISTVVPKYKYLISNGLYKFKFNKMSD